MGHHVLKKVVGTTSHRREGDNGRRPACRKGRFGETKGGWRNRNDHLLVVNYQYDYGCDDALVGIEDLKVVRRLRQGRFRIGNVSNRAPVNENLGWARHHWEHEERGGAGEIFPVSK